MVKIEPEYSFFFTKFLYFQRPVLFYCEQL
jgi:hypothetical protein